MGVEKGEQGSNMFLSIQAGYRAGCALGVLCGLLLCAAAHRRGTWHTVVW